MCGALPGVGGEDARTSKDTFKSLCLLLMVGLCPPALPQTHYCAILGPIKNIIFDQLCVAIVMPKMWLLNKGTKKKLFPEEQTQ